MSYLACHLKSRRNIFVRMAMRTMGLASWKKKGTFITYSTVLFIKFYIIVHIRFVIKVLIIVFSLENIYFQISLVICDFTT